MAGQVVTWCKIVNYGVLVLFLVKCYDNKTGLGVFCLVILPLTRLLVPNPQKKKTFPQKIC